MALGRLNKAIIHGFVNKSEEVVVVAINIEQTHLQNCVSIKSLKLQAQDFDDSNHCSSAGGGGF